MAKQSGLGDNFYIAGFDLSGDISSIDKVSGGPAYLDVTPINKFANVRIPGLRDGSLSFTTFWESTSTVTTPGVPASGTPVVSTYNFSVLVTVTGGTGTQVAINGVNQGSFDGTYVLPALGSITLTYTVVPTWSWIKIGTEHDALNVIPTGDVVCSYLRGTAQGNVAACINAKQTNYDPTRDASGNLTMKVDLVGNSFGLEWGVQLTPGLRADVTGTNGPSLNNGAGTNFGMQAYLQLVELVGSNVDVAIQHSTDNTTFNTLLDFGSKTAIGAFRGSVSNTTTVNQYLRVSTTGTFTYAQFSVVACRNPIAGVVF